MKKLLSLVLTVCVLAAPMAASSADTEDTTDVVYAAETFQIGDYIQLGKYDGIPIIWRYVSDDSNGKLMWSDERLCRKAFDVPGSKNTSSHAQRAGGMSNYWGDSNIRSWLNSDASAGEVAWLCGNPPVDYEISNMATPTIWPGYADEKGFLADGNFTQSERDVIKEVTQKTILDRVDSEVAVGGDWRAWQNGDRTNSIRGFKVYIKSFVEELYDDICFEYTTDKIFLLEINQFLNILKNPLLSEEKDKLASWLRTPFGYEYQYSGTAIAYSGCRVLNTAIVGDIDSGYIDLQVSFAYNPIGIRPAFYLDETTAQILSGSGTEEDPYVVDGKKR